ncbi:hypothetical protein [Coraliomargarita akajimensis]|uniref:Roadblock/LC7 family protein n=1 Tax=Coraliomargarita akajimensis (strain DSM 45221 / IAM 15411 / JCM 23193 / KCTC 12865 / 04OKA010-24) TaxID=583355 RepID=D5ELM6_CORAD|nr:hypothetical protein [Coraliomargarita akajimensis]ADE53201.1 hypothetical protein Caka_0174 [Coraliomargarita akajimensis DSM 45221]
MIDKIIKNVLELPGVDGACILDKKGKLLHNELPDFFLTDFLDDLSRRVTSLYEAVDENYVPCDDYLLKFPQKFIQLRRSRHVYLLVAVDPSVNLVSLRMVTNLVLKHITPKVLSELRASAASAELPTPVVEPPEPSPKSVQADPEPPVATEPIADKPEPPATRRRAVRPRPARSFRGTSY